MIKVLIVEDSPVVREFLSYVLSADPDIEVIGTADNGEEALEAVKRKRPNVVTMDIHMPKLNGFDATRRIMETYPTPIVIVSGSTTAQEIATTFRALEAGALAIVPRPKGIGHPEHQATAKELVQTVKLMSEVKVVRRWPRPKTEPAIRSVPRVEIHRASAEVKIVAMGASTGGPIVLQTILSELDKDFAAPILVVQHMTSGFIEGFAEWLSQSSGLPAHVAADGEYISPGHVYIAQDGFQMGVKAGGRIALSTDEPENGLRPSVSYLFRSVADVYGRQGVGVLLTGMGKDGAAELKLMKDSGAITIVQDEKSSVVPGMPGEAIKLGAESYVLSPDRIAGALKNLVKR
ncbi:MAG: chemotaxis-specific protein-glutamate methyltransferase CheB [Deltaproteobacteria bacterium]|nr:chemotaxis-specific protein-glutamate methyltransferase CheB [Deltaproteobacteria bacterium]